MSRGAKVVRDWKPGDVAVATFDHGGTGRVFRVFAAPSNWCDMAGVCAPEGQIDDVRPLVVIDPDDREQVERLTATLRAGIEAVLRVSVNDYDLDRIGDKVQAALRSLIEPPKPPEPTGLYSVVEDDKAVEWVRAELIGTHQWHSIEGAASRWADWPDITAVRVLSEGVRS